MVKIRFQEVKREETLSFHAYCADLKGLPFLCKESGEPCLGESIRDDPVMTNAVPFAAHRVLKEGLELGI